jgi:endonuclease YncB( thermonuclease family)
MVVVALLGSGCAAQRELATDQAGPARAEAEPVEPPPGEQATVVDVVDGELASGTTERVRSPQIDTPEMDECGYTKSAAILEELILGETVRLVPTAHGPDRDSHGRLLRAAEVDGADVGQLLIRAGLPGGCRGTRTRTRGWPP